MLTKVVELEVTPPYGLAVRFNTGQRGTHDCSKLVQESGPMNHCATLHFFARAFLEFGAPTWPERLRHVA